MKKSTNHQMDRKLKQLLDQGVAKGVFPGASAAISIGTGAGRQRYTAVAGIKDISDRDNLVEEDTFFDLASLSKALSTTLIIYSLIGDNKIEFDTRLKLILQGEIDSDKCDIMVRHLLSHSSGMISYKPYYKGMTAEITEENRDMLLRLILAEPLIYKPGTECLYSDPGFIILGHLIEQITGGNLAANFKQRISLPLGIDTDIFYVPISECTVDKQHYAATEDCPWRKKILRAEVHDEHCWMMNGISGHAGLFGTVNGVIRLCEEILDQWQGRGKPCSWSNMLREGLSRQYAAQSWCLGFDSPSEKGSSAGTYISPGSVGHLGYAGTSFWIDPERELVMVLLTNRVHPNRENNRIREFRPYFHNSIIRELPGSEQ